MRKALKMRPTTVLKAMLTVILRFARPSGKDVEPSLVNVQPISMTTVSILKDRAQAKLLIRTR